MQIQYIPKSGNFMGFIHTPFKNKDGMYIVSKDRFLENYIYVSTIEDAYYYLQQGLKIRMQYENNAPSLIKLSSLEITF